MGVKVQDPKQNAHKWTGTLAFIERRKFNNQMFSPGQEMIFIKTSRDAHFVAQGTRIKDINFLSAEGDAKEAIRNLIKAKRKIGVEFLRIIRAELLAYEIKLPIVEIIAVDNVNTPPLTKVLNSVTRGLFSDDNWLNENAESVGPGNIRVGRELKALPLPVRRKRR